MCENYLFYSLFIQINNLFKNRRNFHWKKYFSFNFYYLYVFFFIRFYLNA